jgi:hypothetical protein
VGIAVEPTTSANRTVTRRRSSVIRPPDQPAG